MYMKGGEGYAAPMLWAIIKSVLIGGAIGGFLGGMVGATVAGGWGFGVGAVVGLLIGSVTLGVLSRGVHKMAPVRGSAHTVYSEPGDDGPER